MKKVFACIMALVCVFSFCSCSKVLEGFKKKDDTSGVKAENLYNSVVGDLSERPSYGKNIDWENITWDEEDDDNEDIDDNEEYISGGNLEEGGKKIPKPKPAPKPEPEPTPEPPATPPIETEPDSGITTDAPLSLDQVLADIIGTHIYSAYIDTYKATGSAIEASDDGFSLEVFNNSYGAVRLMLTDLHQGSNEFGEVETFAYKNGKYTIITSYVPDTGRLKLVYTPGMGEIQINARDHVMWKYGSDLKTFYSYPNYEDAQTDIACSIFSGMSDVIVDSNGAYTTLNDTTYILKPNLDRGFDESQIEATEYDGNLIMERADSGEFNVAKFDFNEEGLTIYNDLGEVYNLK